MSNAQGSRGQELAQELRHGARVSPLSPGGNIILVEQTSRVHPGTGNNPFTIDHSPDGKTITRHVHLDNDVEIAKAIRDALLGQL